MLYRETGQFKTNYAADMAIFTIRQDRIAFWLLIVAAFIGVPVLDAFQIWPFGGEYLLRAIFIPFLIIDMVVAATLTSMGMMMLPPVLISLPFKVLLFVLVDGWHLVVQATVASFH